MITNNEINIFIAHVEEARRTLPSPISATDIYTEFSIDSSIARTSQRFRDTLWLLIRQAIVRPENTSPVNLRRMRSALFRRARFLDDGSDHYLIPAMILYGVNETYFAPISDKECWIKAIRVALILYSLSPGYRPDGQDPRDLLVIEAAQRWVSRGYKICLEGQTFIFAEEDEKRAIDAIDNMAQRIGGQRIIHFLLKSVLAENGHFQDGRFSIPRSTTTIPNARPTNSLPFGYSVQIAARHMRPNYNIISRTVSKSFLEHITDLIAILDIEAFSPWELVFTDQYQLPSYVQVAGLNEFCLNIRQIRPKDALHIIEHIFAWAPDDLMNERHGWKMKDALQIAKQLLSVEQPCPVNVIFDLNEIHYSTTLPRENFNSLLNALTHRTDNLNTDFIKPSDAESSNFYQKPLIWQPGDKVLLPAPSISAVGFIEASLDAVRMIDDQADNKTGLAMELMLAEAFRCRGIQPSAVSLHYSVNRQRFDCDLLVETDDTIIFFEIKKKDLSRPALAGKSLDGLLDLCLAMVKAQVQLIHHELQLAEGGVINFEDGTKLRSKGRRIEKIAVTLLDWGGVQDRTVSDVILKQLYGKNIAAEDATSWQKKKMKEANMWLDRLTESGSMLTSINGKDHPFYDCTFLGVPQVLFLLDSVTSPNEFVERLRIFNKAQFPISTCIEARDIFNGLGRLILAKPDNCKNRTTHDA